jgi:hypothetical protein
LSPFSFKEVVYVAGSILIILPHSTGDWSLLAISVLSSAPGGISSPWGAMFGIEDGTGIRFEGGLCSYELLEQLPAFLK